MPDVRVWQDTPKQGETYGGWFYSLARNGHIYKIEGGFADEGAATRAAIGVGPEPSISARVYQETFPHPGYGRWYFAITRNGKVIRTGGGNFLEKHTRRDLSNFARFANLRGEEAYIIDCIAHPTYHDGSPRKKWHQLDAALRWNWETRNGTAEKA